MAQAIPAQQRPKENLPSWRDLLTARGSELWSVRTRAWGVNRDDDDPDDHDDHDDHDEDDDERKEDPSTTLTVKSMVALSIWNRPPERRPRRSAGWRWLFGRSQRHYQEQVMLLSCPQFFQTLEHEQDERQREEDESPTQRRRRRRHHCHGLDKPDTTGIPPRPLNRCIGDEWKRQRSQVQSAFDQLPERSLRAARNVSVRDVLMQHTKTTKVDTLNNDSLLLDWKQAAADVSVLWVVRLFRGHADARMEQACRAFWQVSRSVEPVASKTMALRRRALVECYYYNNNENNEDEDGGREEGVLDSLLHCGLSRTEAVDNAVNAMIAAVDAVQALLFWTIWNLTKTNTGWRTCQEQVMQTTTNDHDDDAREQEQFQNDLDGLAKFKQTATRGERVDYSNLTYLGRALCETLRVFPPVWTLPRTWPNTGDSHLIPYDAAVSVPMNNGRPALPIRFSKFDIPTANGTKSYRDWNPNGLIATTPHSTYMTSFGLGRRHCPAGTAAIFAVYYYLTEIFQIIEELEESQENHALDSARLLPTLSVVGPQWFRVVYHDPKK